MNAALIVFLSEKFLELGFCAEAKQEASTEKSDGGLIA